MGAYVLTSIFKLLLWCSNVMDVKLDRPSPFKKPSAGTVCAVAAIACLIVGVVQAIDSSYIPTFLTRCSIAGDYADNGYSSGGQAGCVPTT